MTRALMVAGLACVAAGTLAAQQPPSLPLVYGRHVSLQPASASAVSGELLGVRADSVWVLQEIPQRVVALRLADVRSASVRRHGMTPQKALLWGGVVGLVSGIGLQLACNSVEDTSCGGIVAGVTLWGFAFGGIAALTLGPSTRWRFEPVTAEQLAPFARFPQGPPPGLADSLVVRPAPAPVPSGTP